MPSTCLVARAPMQCRQSSLDHFQHHHREPLVWELPSDPPALPQIELDRRRVRLDNAKPERSTATSNDFSFALRQQPAANPAPAALAKHPKITNPLFMCQHHAGDRGVYHGNPGEAPVLLVHRNRRGSPQAAVHFVHDGLHQGSNSIVLSGQWPSDESLDHRA